VNRAKRPAKAGKAGTTIRRAGSLVILAVTAEKRNPIPEKNDHEREAGVKVYPA
jgi:hypothetical protein